MEVQELLHRQLGEQVRALDALVAGDIAAFNQMLQEKGMAMIGGS
jgi:hypothetical protein